MAGESLLQKIQEQPDTRVTIANNPIPASPL
jgi:hypothetical protein